MLMRALIVLLLVLNLGVALWWVMRPPTPAITPEAPAPGVARLQLVGEARAVDAPAPLSGAVAARPAAPVAAPAQCVSFGPFPDTAAVVQAQQRLQPLALRVIAREVFAGAARGWNVFLPPFASTAEAEAVAQRVAAAGFGDYFIVRDGSQANSLALGRYGAEATARRRVDALVAAGFPAHAEPIGAGPPSHWLDVAAATGFDAARAQALVTAPERRILDCATLR